MAGGARGAHTRHGRATACDFFAIARQNTRADISDLISAYFRGGY
jgi:hypothetical protein